jgi:hypothetical protein
VAGLLSTWMALSEIMMCVTTCVLVCVYGWLLAFACVFNHSDTRGIWVAAMRAVHSCGHPGIRHARLCFVDFAL